jgi:hypothetical protein
MIRRAVTASIRRSASSSRRTASSSMLTRCLNSLGLMTLNIGTHTLAQTGTMRHAGECCTGASHLATRQPGAPTLSVRQS